MRPVTSAPADLSHAYSYDTLAIRGIATKPTFMSNMSRGLENLYRAIDHDGNLVNSMQSEHRDVITLLHEELYNKTFPEVLLGFSGKVCVRGISCRRR